MFWADHLSYAGKLHWMPHTPENYGVVSMQSETGELVIRRFWTIPAIWPPSLPWGHREPCPSKSWMKPDGTLSSFASLILISLNSLHPSFNLCLMGNWKDGDGRKASVAIVQWKRRGVVGSEAGAGAGSRWQVPWRPRWRVRISVTAGSY